MTDVATGTGGAMCQWSSSTLLRYTCHVECICNLAISSNHILLFSFQLAKLSISLWKLHICLLTTSLFVKLQHLLISVIVWRHVGMIGGGSTLRRIGVWPPLSLFSFRKRGSIGIKEMGQHTIKLVYRYLVWPLHSSMRIYIKQPYTDKKVEDSSDDGDDIVDVYDDMTRRGMQP